MLFQNILINYGYSVTKVGRAHDWIELMQRFVDSIMLVVVVLLFSGCAVAFIFHHVVMLSFCRFVASSFRRFVDSLFRRFIVSLFRLFVVSSFRRFVVSYCCIVVVFVSSCRIAVSSYRCIVVSLYRRIVVVYCHVVSSCYRVFISCCRVVPCCVVVPCHHVLRMLIVD